MHDELWPHRTRKVSWSLFISTLTDVIFHWVKLSLILEPCALFNSAANVVLFVSGFEFNMTCCCYYDYILWIFNRSCLPYLTEPVHVKCTSLTFRIICLFRQPRKSVQNFVPIHSDVGISRRISENLPVSLVEKSRGSKSLQFIPSTSLKSVLGRCAKSVQ